MPSVTLKAHFDGERIRLDDPYPLPANAQLLITRLEPLDDGERECWTRLARRRLADAYGDDEPDYDPVDVIRS